MCDLLTIASETTYGNDELFSGPLDKNSLLTIKYFV